MTLTDPTPARRAERLFATHAPALLRYVRRRDPSIADDVVAEVFATAWRRIDEIPHDAEFGWLRGTADHVMRNHWRARRRSAALVDAIGPTISEAADPIEPPVVGEALRALGDRDRALLTMTGWEGLTAPEAAERLGISPGTARNVLVRARRDFAAHLAAAGIVIACAVAALLFVRSAPDRAVVTRTAEAIQRARVVRQALAVRVPGEAAPTAVAVVDDRVSGRRTVRLPGGVHASAPRGGALRIDRRADLGASERRTAARRYAQTLAALDATAPDRVARLLSDAGVGASATTRFGGRLARRVSGPVVVGTARWEVEVLVDARAARPLRARARLARAGTDWTTISVRHWQLAGVLPRATASVTPAATPATRAPSAPRGSAPAGRGTVASAPAIKQSQRAARNARRLTRAAERAGTAPYAPYAGSTGAILHLRTALAPVAPGARVRGRYELWVELGHGRRVRQVRTTVDGDARTRTDRQSSPTALIELRGATAPVLSVRCPDRADVAADEWARRTITTIDTARRQRSAYRAGPLIAGEPTIVVPGIHWTSSDYPATLYLSAGAGEIIGVDDGTGPRQVLTWEVLPAGGPADPLEPRIPRDVVATGPRGC